MKISNRKYKGLIITGFNLRQLGDSTVRGMSYSVYTVGGTESLSSNKCLTTLSEAKDFVSQVIATNKQK
jgi:hypothetical protein